MREIDYVHEQGATLYRGTFTNSDEDRRTRVRWVWSASDGTETAREEPVDAERFEYLWGAVAELPAFRRCAVRRDFAGTDPAAFHLIGTYVTRGGREEQWVYLVPTGEADAGFAAWLRDLGRPWADGAE